MQFVHIELLFLIWAVPVLALLAYYGGRRRRKILAAFARSRTLANLVPQTLTGRRRLKTAFILTAMALVTAAAAGPQYGFQWQEIERRGVDLIIALDCSRSMLAQDIQPTRLDRAKREIYDLLNMLEGDRVGLVAFSGTAFMQCPLTLDAQAFHLFLSVLTPDYLPVGGTDLAGAVRTALAGFDPKSTAGKAIILITDGENTGSQDPMEAVGEAQKADVKLFCIGVGSGDGVPVPAAEGGFKKDTGGQIVLSRLDEALLTHMAVTTGGTYVRSVAGDMDLDTIYRDQIRGTMKKAALESGRKQVWADRFQWPLAVAVALLFTALWIPALRYLPVAGLLLVLLSPCGQARAGSMQEGYKAYEKGEYDKALQKFINGQLQNPEDPAVLYNLGNAYYKTGDFNAAKDHYSQALGKAEKELKSKLLYNLGNTAYRQGDMKQAVENYEAALNLAPDDRQAQDNLTFVKKRMEAQQQQQQNAGDQGPKQDGQDEPQSADQNQGDQQKNQQQGGQQQDQQQDGRQPPPQYGSETDQKQPGSEQQSAQQQPLNQQTAGNQADKEHQDTGQGQQRADTNALNRLKDEPGRAMMPAYKKRMVQKDW